jgi:hypothetical protein
MTDSTTSTAKPATPFPVSDGANPTSAGSQGDALSSAAHGAEDSDAGESGAAPLVDGLIERAARSAHAAVDSVSERVSAMASGLRDRVDGAGDTRDEWIESARDAIRQHPFAAVAGAVLIGAALLSLRSPRER